MIPKISVLVITYNQENVISRALESLLKQKDYIYEICINDDCSKDNTWSVLEKYAKQYPELIKPIRNQQNLGIFQNIEATWERPSGDIVYHLSGDDECGEGYFKAVIDLIQNKNIDYKNELFCIYGDYVQKFPNGKSIYCSQKSATRDVLPIRLKLRGIVSNRTACYSISILRKFKKVSEGRSYSVESVQDCQLALFSEKNYYVPVVGNIYYAAIGVSINSKKNLRGRKGEMRAKLLAFMEREGFELNKKDEYFMQFTDSLKSFEKLRSIGAFFKMMCSYVKSLDFSLGMDTFCITFIRRKTQRRRFHDYRE